MQEEAGPSERLESRAPYDPMPHGPAEVGVGPWEGPWPGGPQWDADLLAHGDRRNVVDRYRYWSMEAIVRTANAFLAAEVHIVGNRRWNRRGAMVTDRYQHVRHHQSAEDLAAYLRNLPGGETRLFGIDNLPGSAHLETMAMPRRVCFLFGQEGPGLSEAARVVCDGTLSIAQFGSTRSINASSAAAIAMHTWIRQYADLGDEAAWRG